jgi:hypothetical protein
MNRSVNPDNPETWIETTPPWDAPVRARVLCPDGVYRIARTAQSADTYFSLPARVTVKGKTVSGFITSENNELVASRAADGTLAIGYYFVPVLYGKNHAMLPEWIPFD